MKKLVLFVSLMIMICASYAQIYKWTDSQGVIHFSDNPQEGAQKLNIPESQTYSPPSPKQDAAPKNEENSEDKEIKYTKIAIIQPLNQSTIRNNQGYVVVAVQLEPKLSPGDNLQMIFDGSPLGDPQPNLLFQLNGIYRGSHTLAVQVINANGEVLLTTDSITIYMQRPRVGMVPGGGGPKTNP